LSFVKIHAEILPKDFQSFAFGDAQMKEIDNILRILQDTKRAVSQGDIHEMKRLSGQTIHTATISQDGDNIVVAVLVYALSKIFEREHYRTMAGWKEFHRIFITNLDIAIAALGKEDIAGFRVAIGKIRNSLNTISGDLKNYTKDIFYKAEVNKAFKLYEHGLSSEQTAKMLGISLWDLSSYIGQSTISEASASESLPVEERIKIAEEMFS
jgi:hypothetical protein